MPMSPEDQTSLPITLDEIDRKIIRTLQSDGRLTNLDLAAQVGLSPTPCLRRVRKLEEAGVIAGYVALVDQTRVNLPVNVFVSVSMDKQHEETLEAFEREVRTWPEVMECYLMTGDSDYLLRIVARDLQAYNRFLMEKLTRMPGLANIRSSFSLKQVAYSASLPV